MDTKINAWQCAKCGVLQPGPDLDLWMALCNCGVGAGQWGVIDLAAALKASEEQNGAIRRGLDWERAEREKVAEFARKIGRERDDLAAANLAANKRIEELEHERDAARAEFARLTTPRPIVEAPRDGTWVLLPFSTSKWDACRGPSPQYVTARWFAAAWADPNGALLTEPSHYLPLPDVKP